jgi:predicted amidohydrolase YtcJ
MRRTQVALFVGLAALATAGCRGEPAVQPATLVVRGGTIVTVEHATPRVQALAARGDRIVAVGTDEEIAAYVGPTTEVVELAGHMAMPGFIDGHAHFTGLGESRMRLDLMDARSWDEVVRMVAEAARTAEPGDWIVGRGWHQEKWTSVPEPNVEGFPLHGALSAVSPANPVLLTHASGHASFVNARAMAAAGITARTANPAGGEILKDAAGRPIGVLRETASGLATRALEAWRRGRSADERAADARRAIDLAVQTSLENGITSFQDAGSSVETVEQFERALADGRLGVRLWVMVRDTPERLRRHLRAIRVVGKGDHRLTVAAIKVTIDGALGSRGAWLLEPYSDLAGHTGLNTVPIATLEEVAAIAIETDTQLCVHAIGDRANREALNVFEAAFAANPSKRDLRWRIEHAQHLHPSDIPRFAALGVIASMQGIHCTSDAPFVPARLGTKRSEEGAYVWRTLIDSGAVVTNGTDAPVERISPIASFHASVTRRLADGSTFYPAQRMTRDEALRSYTINAAYSAREETVKGSLAVGKLADITVLSQDITTVPDERLLQTRVLATIVGGRVAYRAPAR